MSRAPLSLHSKNVIDCDRTPMSTAVEWTPEAKARLKEIPFFVRPAARKKIERFAQEAGTLKITIEVYEQAKQKFG